VEFDAANFGVIGLETSLAVALTYLVDKDILMPADLVEKMSLNPNRILGLDGGTLSKGKRADITIIDPKTKWKVDSADFFSKSATRRLRVRTQRLRTRDHSGRRDCVYEKYEIVNLQVRFVRRKFPPRFSPRIARSSGAFRPSCWVGAFPSWVTPMLDYREIETTVGGHPRSGSCEAQNNNLASTAIISKVKRSKPKEFAFPWPRSGVPQRRRCGNTVRALRERCASCVFPLEGVWAQITAA